MSGFPLSRDGERDRFTVPAEQLRVTCDCGKRVDTDDAVICDRCYKVMCDGCASEVEIEAGCCIACLPSHVWGLQRERDDARASERGCQRQVELWRRRHDSVCRLSVVLMVLVAGLVWWAVWR